MKRLGFFVPLVGLLVLLLLPTAALATPTTAFNKSLNKVFAQGYPQAVDRHLSAMAGTNPQLGFSLAGTRPDNLKALYLAQQLRDLGLRNVHLEAVPVDVFTFKSATVTVGGRTMVASTFAGVTPTSATGLTASIVYAHDGMAADYDALATAGVSVQGKLVLVDADLSEYWANYAAAEATARGAIGVIMTYGPDSAPYYSFAPDALGTFDGCWQLSYDPTVYIAKQDGDWLKTQLAANGTGPAATMKLIEKVRMAGKGGVGYNVFGDLPGTVNDGTFVLLAAHHDAYFHSGTDDTSCVADNLAIAKAMVASGYQPKHTVRFMFDTAEEFGYTNAYYDWCIGAWQAITQRHPAWAGKIRLFLNSDYFANEAPLDLSTSADLAPLTRHVVATSAALLPHGSTVSTAQGTWTDGWTFQAAGVPTIAFGASAANADNGTYHTQYMLPGQVDWPYVAKIAKVTFRLADAVQTGLLPYDVETRATELASQVVPADLTRAGASITAVARLKADIGAFHKAAAAYEARKGAIPTAHYATVNSALLRIEKTTDRSFTALTVWDETIYPHQQVLSDIEFLDAALAALHKTVPDTSRAQAKLSNVALTAVGLVLDHSKYKIELRHHDPTYARVTWGGQGHLVHFLDVIPQYKAIANGTWNATTVAQLAAMRNLDVRDLNARLRAMDAALRTITPQIQALR
jgi:Peptidase family M28